MWVLVQEHLPLRGGGRHHPDRRRHAPEVVQEHRDGLPYRREPIRSGAELQRDVSEVLRVQTEIRVEVGHQRARRIESELVARGLEHRSAICHCRRLAHHDAGEQGVADVQEGAEPVAELVAQAGDVLDPAGVGFAGDDRADAQVLRVVLRNQGEDGCAENLVRLGVRRDERALHHLGRSGCSRGTRCLELLTALPPVDASVCLECAHRPAHAQHHDRRADQPVGVEQHRPNPEDPEHARVVEPDREGDDHGNEQGEPGERAGEDFKEPLLGMLRQRDR